jgi:hypothetical protein
LYGAPSRHAQFARIRRPPPDGSIATSLQMLLYALCRSGLGTPSTIGSGTGYSTRCHAPVVVDAEWRHTPRDVAA